MDKYNRNYVLLIGKKDGTTLKVTRPFTVEFDIHRNSLSSANVAQIRVYNLSPNNRSQIRKDQFDTLDLRQIMLFAGYGNNLSMAFKGNITQAWSVREGNNMITQIESFDGGYAYINAITGKEFNKDTPVKAIVDALAESLPGGVTKGAVGAFPGKISRGNSHNGNTLEILNQITGQACFIDNGKIHCLHDDECLDGDVPLINAQSGLLGTPVKETTYINFDMLFEPSLKVAQLIELKSETADHFNGTHKVLSIKHHGMISEAVCGNVITSVGLLPGKFTTVAEGA